MAMFAAEEVTALVEAVEEAVDGRVVDLAAVLVGDEVLLANVRDVARLRILGEQVIERLVPGRAQVLGDRLIPFLAVGEFRVNVEDDAAEIEQAVANHVANAVVQMAELPLETNVLFMTIMATAMPFVGRG